MPGAGAGLQPRGMHDESPCIETDGGHIVPASGEGVLHGARWAPPGHCGRPDWVPAFGPWVAGAACWAPASSGGVLSSFLLLQVVVCVGADQGVCVAVEIRWCVRVPGTIQSDTAPSTVREHLREKPLSMLMLTSIQAPLAGIETMEGLTGRRLSTPLSSPKE